MQDVAALVRDALAGGGADLLAPDVLKAFGFPDNTSQLETASKTYYDTVRVPLTVLSDITIQQDLFTSRAQGFARNLVTPIPGDVAFVHSHTTANVSVMFDPALTTDTTNLFGPSLANVPYYLLAATTISAQISNKNYMQSNLLPWANYQTPNILQPLLGQGTNAPFAVSPSSYHSHHRINDPQSPVNVWPAGATLIIPVVNQEKTWWSQALATTDETPDFTVAPWPVKISAILQINFHGLQIRRVK